MTTDARSPASSKTSNEARPASVFSSDSYDTNSTSPARVAEEDDDLVEIDQKTFEENMKANKHGKGKTPARFADEDDDLVEIDQKAFEENVEANKKTKGKTPEKKTNASQASSDEKNVGDSSPAQKSHNTTPGTSSPKKRKSIDLTEDDDDVKIISAKKRKSIDLPEGDEDVKIIDGSTLGGYDPIHAMIRGTIHEPKWWVDEREREGQAHKKRKGKKTKPEPPFSPSYLENMPYSPQDYFTSGLDQECEPEHTSEEFWEKVGAAWEWSVRTESVEARRAQLERGFFEEEDEEDESPPPQTPEEPVS